MNPQDFLREALRLARHALDAGVGGPFGAVIVSEGQIIARGWNCVTSTNDPTAHAEIMAIRAACARRQSFSLAGCELFASCEPCPMCLSAIYWARLSRVYYAAMREDAAAAGFDDAQIYEELGRPPPQRRLPVVQDLRSEALPVFAAWRQKPDRRPY